MRFLVLVVVVAACNGTTAPAKPKSELVPSSPELPPAQPIDPSVKGAVYLSAIADQIQPRWTSFLEDCRLRLPIDHALNDPSLVATFELQISGRDRGPVHLEAKLVRGSGNADFDKAARDVLREVQPGTVPPELESDDGRIHLRWLFARDRRQAGPATAKVVVIEKPLDDAVRFRLQSGDLDRAAVRVANAPDDEMRIAATESIMIAALVEGLGASDSPTRAAALEAAARAKLAILAVTVRGMIGYGETKQRVQAIETAAAMCRARPQECPTDQLAEQLLVDFDSDFGERPQIALAKTAALVALGKQPQVTEAVRLAFSRAKQKKLNVSIETAVAALAIVPDPKLAPELVNWFARGAPQVRQAICEALPAAAPKQTTSLLARGLRDADATVRGTCAGAAARQGKRADRATIRRLVELARDRDELARAHAIAALGMLDPTQRPRVALEDRAPNVRAAAAIGATEADLRTLARDREPEVRAAALATLADRQRAPELALAAVADESSQVRLAAVGGITDDTVLEKLATDADPDVATAALTRYAERRGRAAATTELLKRLVAAPPKSLERVRIARAWLLAR